MATHKPTYRLGILTEHFASPHARGRTGYYRDLAICAKQVNMEVVAFGPKQINWTQASVDGYSYNAAKSEWQSAQHPLPEFIYDRYFPSTRHTFRHYRQSLHKITSSTTSHLLNHRLADKWTVTRFLLRKSKFRPYIPHTELLASWTQVMNWLALRSQVIIKPCSSNQGKSVILVHQLPQRTACIQVTGRNARNLPIQHTFTDVTSFLTWLSAFTQHRLFMLQAYCSLSNQAGHPFDVRALIQKKRSGQWQLTGMAIRQGSSDHITANLHGGGRSFPVKPYLTGEFGQLHAESLISQIEHVAVPLSHDLACGFGCFIEFGIDFGVDRAGKLWLLEVNSKPGRDVFKTQQEMSIYHQSITNLIDYIVNSSQHLYRAR